MKRTAFAVPLALGSVAGLFAQTAAPPSPTAALEASVKAAQSAGDNAWMLTSCALVLMMTGPGLALFYGGLVRKKKRFGYHDAKLYPDGPGIRFVGRGRIHFEFR